MKRYNERENARETEREAVIFKVIFNQSLLNRVSNFQNLTKMIEVSLFVSNTLIFGIFFNFILLW